MARQTKKKGVALHPAGTGTCDLPPAESNRGAQVHERPKYQNPPLGKRAVATRSHGCRARLRLRPLRKLCLRFLSAQTRGPSEWRSCGLVLRLGFGSPAERPFFRFSTPSSIDLAASRIVGAKATTVLVGRILPPILLHLVMKCGGDIDLQLVGQCQGVADNVGQLLGHLV